ncbi:hypothetical protein ABVT39_024094 [Epinephelus coioides]
MSIHMSVHELDVCAVLDSGARKSVLSLRHYNAIHPNARPPLQPSGVETLLGVGPGDVPVLGEAYIPVQINNRQVSVHFLVADIAGDEALLGHPFLTQAQARLDFGNRRIVLFGEEVPYFHTTGKPKTHAVRVARTVVLEAGQEYVVRGHAHLREPVKGEVMLSPTKGFVEKHRVLVARVLVETQPLKAIPLRIFNPGNTPVTVKEGAIAGFLQPVESLQPAATTVRSEQPELSTVPQHLQEVYAQSLAELNKEEQLQLAQLLCACSGNVSHQAVQCELDSIVNQATQSSLGVERHLTLGTVGTDTQFYPQAVLPRAFQPDVMRQMHEGPVGGHFGVERTVARLQTRYYWYRMREDVAVWCHTCTSCEVSEPVDLVTGLPPDSETAPSAPEYVQHLRERLELAHQITREALGESVKRAKRQYDKNCFQTQYKVGDAVWYFIKGTQKVRNKIRKFLPSYEGPFFILGQLDDFVYCIQKGPKTKVKVVHHDQLKPYRSHEPLDNAWAMEQAQGWTPREVSPPALDTDSADPDLGLAGLFSNVDADETSTSTPPDPAEAIPATAVSPPATYLHMDPSSPGDLQGSGGGVASLIPQGQRTQRPGRRRRNSAWYGEWVAH